MNKSEKCSNTQKGRIVIHKDDLEKRIYPNELQRYLNEGWIKGVSEKHKEENRKKRIVRSPSNKGKSVSKEVKEKISKTLKERYSTNEISVWNKGLTKDTDKRVRSYSEHSSNTRIERYGSTSYNKGKHLSEEHRRKIGESNSISLKGKHLPKDRLIIKTNKQYLTRKKNNSFNASKPENELYESLLKDYSNKTILRNYKDKDRYPFYCDFYIVEDDLFIELNAHWTHGGKPFNPDDEECIQQLNEWKEKAKTSQFYQNAIQTWTVRDVEKQRVAKENNLNYKVIY